MKRLCYDIKLTLAAISPLRHGWLLLLGLLLSHSAYAILPTAPCHSICSSVAQHTLAPGAHCSDSDNQLIYYKMSGRGKVTMLFASGTGLPSTIWSQANLTTAVSHVAKTFTYDRLYTFNSCANKNNYLPNTAIDVVHRLHRFLQQQQIKPPYILVGHSFGGLYMLLYAKLYPQQVAGLLLLDPTSSAGPTPLPKKALPILRRVGNPQNPTPTNPLYNELIGQYPSYLQVANAPPLERKIPLIVMYATKHCLPKGITQSSVPYCMTAKQEHNHFLEQKKIYNMSDYHKIIRVNGEHNSFFTHEKHSQMVKAFDEIMTMAKPRAKLLAKAYRD